MSGDSSTEAQRFPYTEALIGQGDDSVDLNRLLVGMLYDKAFPNMRITTELGDYKRDDALALAFVLTWESVGTEQFEDFTKLTINLQAEALLFDYASREIVAAYPFGVEYVDSVQATPTRELIISDLKKLYSTQSGGIFDEFVNVLRRVTPKSTFGAKIQVVATDLEQPALNELTQNGVAPDTARILLQDSFERYLSKNSDIPVLPHAVGAAVGNTMAARFINGDIYNLKIPPPDYVVHLTLTNLRKVKVDQTDAETAWAYASYLTVAIDQPLSGRNFLNASFKYPVVKVIANTGRVDDRSELQESLLAISDQVTREFENPSSDWSEKWLVKEAAPGELEKIPDLLAHCR